MEFKLFNYKVKLEVAIVFILIGIFIGCNFICACNEIQEGLTNMLVGYEYDMKDKSAGNLTDWYKHLETNRQNSKNPSPYDLMYMFKNNQISPSCCPSTYSTSNGCVCVTPEQMLYLNKRGLNRYSNNSI